MAEGDRWYDADGNLAPAEILSADGKKMVRFTKRHARQGEYYPSVTTILGQLANVGLDIWKNDQIRLNTLTSATHHPP